MSAVNMGMREAILRLFASFVALAAALSLPFAARSVVVWAAAGVAIATAYALYTTATRMHCPVKGLVTR